MDHTIIHFEIPANDLEKLKEFYEEIFGWTITLARVN
jgi:predicted enzyme related to lactoylglutathione lyase